jgi:hypothetical protein
LAASAAVFVGVVADGVVSESASTRIAALVASTTLITATIAFFVAFYNAVAARLALDCDNAAIVGETARLHAVAAEGCTDIAHGARGEGRDALCSGWVHDEILASIT